MMASGEESRAVPSPFLATLGVGFGPQRREKVGFSRFGRDFPKKCLTGS